MMKSLLCACVLAALTIAAAADPAANQSSARTYPIVGTDQQRFFSESREIPRPAPGEPFYGQDAQFPGNTPSYRDNGDGTVTDNVTGLMWQKDFFVLTLDEAKRKLGEFRRAGIDDWRLPTIKEAYSLIRFSGKDPSGPAMDPSGGTPFLDTRFFLFRYGANGRRPIDSQMLSATMYRGVTMGGNATVFGVNFADGRIKGYPVIDPRGGQKRFMVRFVRGNSAYGKNRFHDNGDGTVSDAATGLMWEQADSRRGMNWRQALAWAQKCNRENHLGYHDWRLPDAKELQSLVDYSRSPQRDGVAAIDPVFRISTIRNEGGRTDFPSFWTSTTHLGRRGGADAVYICFGQALGYFAPPFSRRRPRLLDVHGAGAQRSDPKTGSPADFPRGRGPQGDVVRIFHYVRLVRNL